MFIYAIYLCNNMLLNHNKITKIIMLSGVEMPLLMIGLNITETSPYTSDPRFPPNIVKMGEIWGRNQNNKK